MAKLKTNTSGYLTQEAFEQQAEQLEGAKRFQVIRGLTADVATESIKASTKETQTAIATEGFNQVGLKLEGARVKTDIERLHLSGLKTDQGYLKTEYGLKSEVWELKLQGHRASIAAAKNALAVPQRLDLKPVAQG